MANIRWGYALNQWRVNEADFTTKEQRSDALKVVSVGGFRGVEMTEGAIGGPVTIPQYFGSLHGFKDFLNSCGIDQMCSFVGNPGPGSILNAADHGRIADAAARMAAFVAELGGSVLVVRPMGSYWREQPITPEKLKTAADGWTRVGRATKALGVQTALHVDFLNGMRREADIDQVLKATDPAAVGLALDTAEFTIAGIDPVKFYEKNHARVKHFQFKDAVTTDAQEEYKQANAEALVLNGGGKRGIERWFYEMGTPGGLVDFKALYSAMKRHNYDGWVVAESDQTQHAEESVLLNAWYVKQVLAKI